MEQKGSHSSRIRKSGSISFGRSNADCMVRSISAYGAAPNIVGARDQFRGVTPGDARRLWPDEQARWEYRPQRSLGDQGRPGVMVAYLVKLVPTGSPNADGEWRQITAPPLPATTRLQDAARALSNYIPTGYFVVSYELSDGW